MLTQAWTFIIAWYNLPFTILLGLCLLLAGAQLTGFSAEHEQDGDLDHDVDGDADADVTNEFVTTDGEVDHDADGDADGEIDGDAVVTNSFVTLDD